MTTGVVVEKSDRILPRTTQEAPSAEEDEEAEEANEVEDDVKILPQIATFDRFMVWGHESTPTDVEDPYIKGVDEWMAFAQAVSFLIAFYRHR